MPEFVAGLELSERFYRSAIRPLLDAHFPGLPHSAALIGSGSEVLGFDSAMSTDHHWGPRALIFLEPRDHAAHAQAIGLMLRERLPHSFMGWPTNFTTPDAADRGVQLLQPTSTGPVNHRVDVLTWRDFLGWYLGIDADQPLHAYDWLTLPSQKLRSLTAGAVFHDATGLEAWRARMAWYPHDVWLYLLAAAWARIGQEEHLLGRAGQAGDELGAALIAARLVRDVMRLCFLMERTYAPYPKWYGTAFNQLQLATPEMRRTLERAVQATRWQEREAALAAAYRTVALKHNALGLTQPLPAETQAFHGRPFQVIGGEQFSQALLARIVDPDVRAIPVAIGGVDQWSDSTDLLGAAGLRTALLGLYRAG